MATWARVLILALLLPALGRAADEAPLRWQDARDHVGEDVVVEGVVAAVHCSPLACSLAFEPSFTRFTVTIQARNFDVFPPDELEERFKGKRVRVRGRVETLDGKPRMQVAEADALTLAPETRVAAAGSDGAPADAAAQAALAERLDELLDRMDELSERLAMAETRLAELLAYLKQRDRALAAAQTPAPPAGPTRPAAQALRSLKRGMSSAEVERLAGPPLAAVSGANGWVTWDYGGGRAVTFDQRGRVASLSGFSQ